jgi:hypothetical protein
MHPGVKVQFELDLAAGDAALACHQCRRPQVPNSKNASRLPRKWHPPLACGMTLFGANNRLPEVAALAARHAARLVVVLRRNHLAHAVSAYLHFNQPRRSPPKALPGAPPPPPPPPAPDLWVPWGEQELRRAVGEHAQAYDRLAAYAAAAGRPAHFVFYEDLKARPAEVRARRGRGGGCGGGCGRCARHVES